MNDFNVNSEIEILKKVFIHRPDLGISRVSPKKSDELLFDDIVHLPVMQQEHDLFTDVLRYFVGAKGVIEVGQLIQESLEASEEKKRLFLKDLIQYEELHSMAFDRFSELDNHTLSDILITGYDKEIDRIWFDPIPNFIFTRDIGVIINNYALITKAAKQARFRENLLTRYIFYAHPDYELARNEDRIINLNDIELFPPSRKGEDIRIEGGDVMMVSDEFLLIGSSERTNGYAIDCLAKLLFKKGIVRRVAEINIPTDRSYMHIDTIFTQINQNDIVAYKPIVMDGNSSNVRVLTSKGNERTYPSIMEFYHREINSNMRFIAVGNGESPYQEREQWTDGCNLLALRPGVAVTYDRNPYTDKALQAAGYELIKAVDFLKKAKKEKLKPEDFNNLIITLPSFELSRARGGSHCMTCPQIRESL